MKQTKKLKLRPIRVLDAGRVLGVSGGRRDTTTGANRGTTPTSPIARVRGADPVKK